MFKVNNKDTRATSAQNGETHQTILRQQLTHCLSVFDHFQMTLFHTLFFIIVNFEHIPHLVLVSLLLTLSW